MKKIILASTSPRRKELLSKTGLAFEVMPSSYDEDMTIDMQPDELAMHLSKSKAQVVADQNRDAVVIGADTFLSFEGKVFGKPYTKEKAKEILTMLSGKQHSVFTGFTIIEKSANKSISKVNETKVYFKNLTEKEIVEYIETGEPLDKAGAYAIQGLGGKFVEKVEGDLDNVLGLPVSAVMETLKDFGVQA